MAYRDGPVECGIIPTAVGRDAILLPRDRPPCGPQTMHPAPDAHDGRRVRGHVTLRAFHVLLWTFFLCS